MKFLSIALTGLLAAGSVVAKARTQMDASLYAAISKYPAYSTAIFLAPSLNGKCIPPYGSTLVNIVNVSSTDTQMGIFRNDRDKELIVGIPGANSSYDTFTISKFGLVPYFSPNVNCPLCHVHEGYLEAWNSVINDVTKQLKSQLATHPAYKVIIAGHSLGGALCSLAYAGLVAGKLPVKFAVCSGAPRVGDQFYANYIDSLSGATDTNVGTYYRVTHYNDGVPQLPDLGSGYVHPRTELFEADYNSTYAQAYRCYGQEPGDCNLSLGVNKGINNAHETYAGVRYNCNNGFLPNPCETCPYYSAGG